MLQLRGRFMHRNRPSRRAFGAPQDEGEGYRARTAKHKSLVVGFAIGRALDARSIVAVEMLHELGEVVAL